MAKQRVATYNPRLVTMAAGVHIVSGFADDSFISLEPAGDGTSEVVGADGEVIRSVDPNNLWTCKVTLLQSSESNKYFQNMYNADLENGTGIFDLNIADKMGGETFTGAQAWVRKPASWARGKQAQNREWEIAVLGEFV